MTELVNADILSIENRLNALDSQHLLTHDLTRLLYIRGVAVKASQNAHNYQLSVNLVAKAYRALNELELSLKTQRAKAEEQLALIEEDYEQAFEQASTLFESQSYVALNRLFKGVQKNGRGDTFKELMGEMQRVEPSVNASHKEELVQQSTTNKIKNTDLQSFKQYQTMFEQMALDRLLARVMKEIPENAGPLNPERLVIRSFKALQELSPDYLSSLISYYESLLTLQLLNSAAK